MSYMFYGAMFLMGAHTHTRTHAHIHKHARALILSFLALVRIYLEAFARFME